VYGVTAALVEMAKDEASLCRMRHGWCHGPCSYFVGDCCASSEQQVAVGGLAELRLAWLHRGCARPCICIIYAQPAGLLTLGNVKPTLVAEAHGSGGTGQQQVAASFRLSGSEGWLPITYARIA
jgi:hypothetical protein